MSEVAVRLTFGQELETALRQGLRKVGIDASIETEAVPDTLLYRALVVSPQFEPMPYSERQEFVRRVLDLYFTREEQLHISSVWAMTPDEVEGK